MNGRTACVIGLALWMGSATAAWAQEKGDAGLAISAPQGIGVIWHPSDKWALRPDLTFSFSETDGEDIGPDISASSIGFGISALFYTHRWDELRLYVSPRLTLSHSSSTVDSDILNSNSSGSGWGVSGSIGGQYSLGSRFGVFAEAGLVFASQSTETNSIASTNRTGWSFGTRTAIGGILYF